MNTSENELLLNLDKLHTTDLGIVRIRRNISLSADDVVGWCKSMILDMNSSITRKGKNWYIDIYNYLITVNCHSYTIITVHMKK